MYIHPCNTQNSQSICTVAATNHYHSKQLKKVRNKPQPLATPRKWQRGNMEWAASALGEVGKAKYLVHVGQASDLCTP